jgi:hypothetical protein
MYRNSAYCSAYAETTSQGTVSGLQEVDKSFTITEVNYIHFWPLFVL